MIKAMMPLLLFEAGQNQINVRTAQKNHKMMRLGWSGVPSLGLGWKRIQDE
jgi:hypothetical protein